MEDVAAMSDTELLDAYEATNGVPGNERADELLVEIKRRNLDL